MNLESSSKMPGTQPGKPTTSKRAHRGSRNRPVLVRAGADEPTMQAIEEARQPVAQTTVEELPQPVETTARRRGPRFFANIGKAEKIVDQPQADPKAARLARAMRGKAVAVAKEETPKEKKPAASAPKGYTPPPRRSRFKTRHIWGMMAYLLIADFLGIYVANFMAANKLDARVFSLGSFPVLRSTLIFLALLVIILVVMARLDLIPRTFGAAGNPPPRRGSPASATKTQPTFETKSSQPVMKQGVKGAHDSLYQEYRENQRYFQKRDRKR